MLADEIYETENPLQTKPNQTKPKQSKQGLTDLCFNYSSRPNIPGYKGCTLWQGQYAPANTRPAPGPSTQPTTSLIHR